MSELSYAPAPTRPPSHCTTVKMLLSFVLRLPFVHLVGALRLPAIVALRLVAPRTHGVPLGSGGPRLVRGKGEERRRERKEAENRESPSRGSDKEGKAPNHHLCAERC